MQNACQVVQRHSFPTDRLSPRDKPDNGQAGKKERISFRFRDDADADRLSCVIDVGDRD